MFIAEYLCHLYSSHLAPVAFVGFGIESSCAMESSFKHPLVFLIHVMRLEEKVVSFFWKAGTFSKASLKANSSLWLKQ